MPVRYQKPPAGASARVREVERYVPPAPDPGAAPLFTAIVPACNEEAGLRGSLASLIGALEEVGETFEIVVVDDGSRDGTGALADRLAEEDPRIRVVHHERNRGLGAAIRTAAAASRGTYLVGSPVDSPLDAEQIRAFHEAMEPSASYSFLPGKAACDIAVGFRLKRPGYRGWMLLCSWVYRMMMRVLFWTWLRDFNWICMYRRSVFERISFESDSFVALPEILVRAKRAGLALRQVPCPMRARESGRGTVARPRMLLVALAGLVRLWFRVTFGGTG